MLRLFDTHSHYNLLPLSEDWSNLAINAKNAGISHSLIAGTTATSSQDALNMREKMPDFFLASAGLHPEIAINQNELDQALRAWQNLDLAAFDAYGEIGLDFYHLDRQAPDFAHLVSLQVSLLKAQLDIIAALPHPRPILFHVRDDFCDPNSSDNAYGLLLKIIAASPVSTFPLVFHCFSGNEAYLRQVLRFPHSFISFAGNLTFKNAVNLRELSTFVPRERLLLETDAPFLSPEPCRGRACLPEFLAHTAAFAATNLGFDLDQIYHHSCQLFSLSPLD